jgi:hypothetical protein
MHMGRTITIGGRAKDRNNVHNETPCVLRREIVVTPLLRGMPEGNTSSRCEQYRERIDTREF